jgi:hypothetical protein
MREITEIVRYFQEAFWGCIVLVVLNPTKYKIITINCAAYEGDEINLIKMIEKDGDIIKKLHFFQMEGNGNLFNMKGLVQLVRDKFIDFCHELLDITPGKEFDNSVLNEIFTKYG